MNLTRKTAIAVGASEAVKIYDAKTDGGIDGKGHGVVCVGYEDPTSDESVYIHVVGLHGVESEAGQAFPLPKVAAFSVRNGDRGISEIWAINQEGGGSVNIIVHPQANPPEVRPSL